jgi:hypothetical protein
MIDFFSGLLTPLIAVLAAYIAWQQWRTNNLRLKHELFERRYKLYEVITSFIANILSRGRVEPNSEMQFLRDTKTVIFLFDNRIYAFVQEIYHNAVDLYSLGARENSLGGQQLANNVDEQRKIMDWFSEQLGACTVRFSPFLSFGGDQTMNRSQRKLVLWGTVSVCLLLATITGVLAFAGFHYSVANQGDVFDKVVYQNHLRWIVPLITALIGLLVIGLIGFVGLWFVLRDK